MWSDRRVCPLPPNTGWHVVVHGLDRHHLQAAILEGQVHADEAAPVRLSHRDGDLEALERVLT